MLVAGDVLVRRHPRRHTGLFQLDDHQRQPVDETDQIGPAGVERAHDAELADQQEIIAIRQMLPINHADAQCLSSTSLSASTGERAG